MTLNRSFLLLGNFLFWTSILSSSLSGQERFSDEFFQYTWIKDRPMPGLTRANELDTLQISAANPFFDDFSNQDREPDTLRWYTPDIFFDVPQLVKGLAVNPPSLGTVLFDGMTRFGEPYSTNNLTSGVGDRLFSHCIDLSEYTVSDQLVLTFALQPQGRGDAPENRDAFEVLFKTTSAPPEDFVKVLTVNGTPLKDFRYYAIPLDDEAFFHSCFQIAFQCKGSLSVPADYWLLDYVHLAPNKSAADTIYEDASPILFEKSPLNRYAAIPLEHFNPIANQQGFSIEVSNNSNQGKEVPYSLEVRDSRGYNPWNGPSSESGSQSLAPFANNSLNFDAFQDQNYGQTGNVDLEFITSLPGDAYPGNDTLRASFKVDSLWAYDDGEADGVFGLNRPLGYGVRLDLAVEDSISAIWIHFEPLLHQNPVFGTITYMKDQTFRTIVWNDAHPDSIVSSKIHRVAYGETRGSYIRYEFNQPVPVSGTCWVGVQQMSDLPLGVGLDRNFVNDDFMYYDSLGTWTRIDLNGSLMIRPEAYHGGRFTSGLEKPLDLPEIRIYPNPSYEKQVQIKASTDWPIRRMKLRNMMGQLIFEQNNPPDGRINLPASLRKGFYVWEIQDIKGQVWQVKWEYRD